MTAWLSVPLAVHLALVVGIFLATFALGRHLGTDPKLRALPTWATLLVAALAMSPYFAMTEGWLGQLPGDEELLGFTLLLTFWAVLPVLAYRLLDPDPDGASAGC